MDGSSYQIILPQGLRWTESDGLQGSSSALLWGRAAARAGSGSPLEGVSLRPPCADGQVYTYKSRCLVSARKSMYGWWLFTLKGMQVASPVVGCQGLCVLSGREQRGHLVLEL